MYSEELVRILTEKNMTITCGESCTGGLVAASIVDVSGASNVFNEGYVTYSNEAKHRLLGVSEETLNTLGAVSKETAEQMAIGCAKAAGANVGISTTGIAGPTGGTKDKPVGLVYIGCSVNGNVTVTKNIFSGNRSEVRKQAVETAILQAINCIK